jgi:hypothetical protein
VESLSYQIIILQSFKKLFLSEAQFGQMILLLKEFKEVNHLIKNKIFGKYLSFFIKSFIKSFEQFKMFSCCFLVF